MAEVSRKIIIDTDPGQDDAIAILLALASPELDVLGISCVAGNTRLPAVIRNARIICELAGRPDVKIFAGAEGPMVRELVTAEHVHGPTGLDGPVWDEPTMPIQPGHAVDWIIETLLAAEDRSITLCPVGPLTNIAMAITREPAILAKIELVVSMGGGRSEGGNITPAAEFNIYVDPQAADVVYRSGLPIVTIPLDVTHRALMPRTWIDAVAAIGSDLGDKTAAMLRFYERFDVEKYGEFGGPVHDPAVIAYLIRPDLYRGKQVHLRVETESELTMGMTVVDFWGVTGEQPNCIWVHDVDSEAFFTLVLERLTTLARERPSP